MKEELPKLSVVTITYGHEHYITDTLDGVMMQEYPGPVEFIIANDNSPDKTEEMIKAYFKENPAPENFEIKYTRHAENKGMSPNFVWALEQTTGKYIALCEGDDYWTDPLKLHKQVSFLEENEDVVACGTYSDILKESFEKCTAKMVLEKFATNDLLKGKWIPTLTNMFRKSALGNAVSEIEDDLTLLANISCNGGYMVKLPFVSAVYRYHGAGVVSGSTLFENRKRNFSGVYNFASRYLNSSFTLLMMKNLLKYFLPQEAKKLNKADVKVIFLYILTYARFTFLLFHNKK